MDASRLWERGRAAWPALAVTPEQLSAHVGRALPDADAATLERVHAEDLFLACACAAGVPGAMEAFDAQYREAIERAIGRIERRPDAIDELRQKLLVRWLVPDEAGRPPRIASYSGRGPLIAWVRIAAGRAALDARRDARDGDDAPLADVADAHDPELAYLRARYRPAFTKALAQALAALTREQRGLLRLHYVEGLTMDALGAMFHTSRAGMHRRLAAARDALCEQTCALLRAELGVSDSERESLLRVVRSGLAAGMAQLLDTHDEPAI